MYESSESIQMKVILGFDIRKQIENYEAPVLDSFESVRRDKFEASKGEIVSYIF
jgi:hypothetical protein